MRGKGNLRGDSEANIAIVQVPTSYAKEARSMIILFESECVFICVVILLIGVSSF